jgi:Flp pilus assembly protein TadD
MVKIGKKVEVVLLGCVIIGVLLSGCATNNAGALQKTAKYGLSGERRLLTTEGKKADQPMNSAEEYERLGDINLQRDDITAAFLNYTKALQLEPERLSASYKTGRLFLYRGMTEDAKREFEKILKKDPKNVYAHEGMGRAFLLENNNEKATEYFVKALKINDHLWEVHDLLGIAYDRQKKSALAVEQYRMALSLKPDATAVYNNLGVSYYLLGEYEKAKDAFITAIEKGGEESKVYNNLALTLGKLGQYRQAEEAFTRAADEATAQNNLGYLYMLDGKNNEAAVAFEKAIYLSPSFYHTAHDNLKRANDNLRP